MSYHPFNTNPTFSSDIQAHNPSAGNAAQKNPNPTSYSMNPFNYSYADHQTTMTHDTNCSAYFPQPAMYAPFPQNFTEVSHSFMYGQVPHTPQDFPWNVGTYPSQSQIHFHSEYYGSESGGFQSNVQLHYSQCTSTSYQNGYNHMEYQQPLTPFSIEEGSPFSIDSFGGSPLSSDVPSRCSSNGSAQSGMQNAATNFDSGVQFPSKNSADQLSWGKEAFQQFPRGNQILSQEPFAQQAIQHEAIEYKPEHTMKPTPSSTPSETKDQGGNVPVQIKLLNSDQWKSYYEQQTEMLVLNGGRRLFPWLECSVTGLVRNRKYCTGILLVLTSRLRQAFDKNTGKWFETDKEAGVPEQTNEVIGSTISGAELMKHLSLVSTRIFSIGSEKRKKAQGPKVPRANQYGNNATMLQVHTLCKYRPVIRVYDVETERVLVAEESFPETEFIVVSAYLNNTKHLKVEENKYARGKLCKPSND